RIGNDHVAGEEQGGGLVMELATSSRRTMAIHTQIATLASVFVTVLVALYWRIGLELIERVWRDDNYSHALLVPFFSGFLIWQRRAELRALLPRGTWLGLPVLMAGVGMLLLGTIAVEDFLMRSSLIVVLAGLVLW